MDRSQRILLIEDDPGVARSLQEGLEREGYDVVWKSTGEEGVAHARNHGPHLIILDVRLPDGSEVVARGISADRNPPAREPGQDVSLSWRTEHGRLHTA